MAQSKTKSPHTIDIMAPPERLFHLWLGNSTKGFRFVQVLWKGLAKLEIKLFHFVTWHHVTTLYDQTDIWHGKCEPLNLSYHCAKFDTYKYCGSRHITFWGFYVAKQRNIFNKFAHRFHSLKSSFENCTGDRKTQFIISF